MGTILSALFPECLGQWLNGKLHVTGKGGKGATTGTGLCGTATNANDLLMKLCVYQSVKATDHSDDGSLSDL